jgi:hypothetical protein
MFKPHVSSNIPIKPIYVQHIKIVIPLNTFQQHLPKTFFQLEVGEMEIDETPIEIRVQNLCIALITLDIAQHWIELDTSIPPTHQGTN